MNCDLMYGRISARIAKKADFNAAEIADKNAALCSTVRQGTLYLLSPAIDAGQTSFGKPVLVYLYCRQTICYFWLLFQ